MFPLYKTRNFSAIINDTFSFFRQNGKNYFKNYFILNGGMLLILLVLCFIMGKVFFERLFSGINSQNSEQLINDYFNNNLGFFIIAGFATGIMILLMTIVNYSYPVIYLNLTEKHENPDAKQILAVLKSKFGRILLFGLMSIITFVPIAILLGFFSMLLIVIIIGIPVAIILFAAFTCWLYLTFYDYMNTNNSYFSSMGNGWKMLIKNFWIHAGCTTIFYLIIYTVQGILAIIPYMIGIITMIVTAENNPSATEETFSTIGILMLIVFMVYIVLAYLLSNVLMVGHGMIYYSCREQAENKSLYNEIDSIGGDFE